MAEDLHERIKAGIVQIVKDLQIEGIGGRVHDQLLPDPANMVFPAIAITIEGESERLTGGDTLIQFNEYPTRVFLMDRVQIQVRHDLQRFYFRTRKTLIDAFNQRPKDGNGEKIPGASEVFKVDVRTSVIIDPKLPQYQFVVSGFTVLCEASEPRRKS